MPEIFQLPSTEFGAYERSEQEHVTTAVGNRTFVHVLNWQDRQLALSGMSGKIRLARLFAYKSPVKFTQTPEGVVLTMANAVAADAVDTIIELEMTVDMPKK